MKKRILIVLLCVFLLVAAFPVTASASATADEEEQQRICKQIESLYRKTMNAAGFGTLEGFCGAMAGWELYFLGVTNAAITQNGNEMYAILKDSPNVNEGYEPVAYPASSYTLEEALNTITNCGTTDAYNIMVGFGWSSSAAGRIYGHVNVIHAILDGMVYFTEGFDTPFQKDPAKAMICTISEFCDYYNSWTRFQGILHFGNGSAVDKCQLHSCNLFVQDSEPLALLTQPSPTLAEQYRTAAPYERLQAIALCEDPEGLLYYQIIDSGKLCYLPVDAADPFYFDFDDLTALDVAVSSRVTEEAPLRICGDISGRFNKIANLVLQIIDRNGQVAASCEIPKYSYLVELDNNALMESLDISQLAPGSYTCVISCDVVNHYGKEGIVLADIQRVAVHESDFVIGEGELIAATPKPENRMVKNGWYCENGSWYYYENDAYRTGWFCENGLDYYFLDDGKAATGWVEINGKQRFFTDTGVMRTGWMDTERGSCYLLSNGVMAVGSRQIDGAQFVFGTDGILIDEDAAPSMLHK